jgi:hypothetical protein
LLHALGEHGLEPQDTWFSVRVSRLAWAREQTYTIVIAYPPARVALTSFLRRTTSRADEHAVGVWVLCESEAHELCEGARTALASPSSKIGVANYRRPESMNLRWQQMV